MCLWKPTEDHPDFDGGDTKSPVWDQEPDDVTYNGNIKKSALHCTIAFEKSRAPLLRRRLEFPSTSHDGEGGSPCFPIPINMAPKCIKCGGTDSHERGCEN